MHFERAMFQFPIYDLGVSRLKVRKETDCEWKGDGESDHSSVHSSVVLFSVCTVIGNLTTKKIEKVVSI